MMNLSDHLPVPFLVTDAQGRICQGNPDVFRLLGKTEAQVLQHSIEEFMPPASRILLQTHLWPLLRNAGEIKEVYLKLSGAQGERIPVMLNCRRSAQALECYYWVFFIATERSHFEEALLSGRNHAQHLARMLAQRERFISNIANNLRSMLAYWDTDLVCRFANRAYEVWFGKTAVEAVGMSMMQLLGERLYALNEPYIQGALTGQAQTFECTLTRTDGSVGQTLANYIPDIDPDGKVAGFIALISDVSALKQAQAELKLAASVFHNTMEGIMISDGDGRIISVNPAFCLITGFAAGEVLGQPSAMLNPVFYAPQAYAARQIDIMRHGRWEGEVWNRRKNGEAYLEWQSISLIPGENPQSMRLVTVFSDVTERWRNSERIKHLAFHDPLTGLPNRTLLLERLGQLILAAGRNQRPAAVLFLDLDGFKQINDTLGHEIGDDLLKAVAQTLLDQVRQGDTVARLGGDEFVIVLDSPENAVEVERIATRIISSVGQDRVLRGNPVRVGISIGIALFPQAGASADALLAAADAAMYRAKHAGKNAWRFYQS